jgi:CubicO group peptidase (beta-lactamase class C family)
MRALRTGLCVLSVLIAASLAAQTPSPNAPAMTSSDIDAFLAGFVPAEVRRQDVAGAVVVVVKDGKILFQKGYGYADVAKQKPVSPDGTLFRPGSVSKLFTWTAIMQLQEQGKLELDRDVNQYLDFHIPDTYPKPITLRNIMTHTPGFEEAIKDLFIHDAKDLQPLDTYLKTHIPQRIFPPGTVPAYSNYATALAGYIVQRISGQPYDEYIEQHILKPLRMEHTTFRQPLPEALKPLMSQGYLLATDAAKPFEVVQAWPAGSSATTGADIARFMLAHLADGQFEGAQILKPETARLMHTRQFGIDPRLNGMALGFYEENRNGHRIIGHGGDTSYFHTDLRLMPDAGLGFFISQNSAGKGLIRSTVWHAFLDRYFPYTPPAPEAVPNAKQDLETVSGRYINSRRSETTIFSPSSVAAELKVYGNEDGTLSTNALLDANGKPTRFREIASLMFREVNGQALALFKRDDSGRWIIGIDYPFMIFQRASWLENSAFNLPVVIGALAVFLLAILLWPVGAAVRWHYGRQLSADAAVRRRRTLVRVVCLIEIAFAAAWVILATRANDIGVFSRPLDPMLRLIQAVGWLGVAGAILALYNGVRAWTDEKRWWFSRVADSVIALACLGYVWFMFEWHMLHWSLIY